MPTSYLLNTYKKHSAYQSYRRDGRKQKKYDVERLKSLRLEKQILGYLLKSEENTKDYYDVAVLLTEKVFADKYNKQIFNVITSLLKAGQTINTVSVAQKLST